MEFNLDKFIEDKKSWVPESSKIENLFAGKAFVLFNRLDSLNKCCDCGITSNQDGRARARSESGDSAKDEDTFQAVQDTSKLNPIKKRYGAPTQVQAVPQNMPANVPVNNARPKKLKKTNFTQRYHVANFNKTKFVTAGAVRSEWVLTKDPLNIVRVEKIENLNFKIEDLFSYGTSHQFEPLFATRIRPKQPLTLLREVDAPINSSSVLDDPVFKELLEMEMGDDKNYFLMTEDLFTALATSHKSSFPWNIGFFRFGRKYVMFANKDDPTSALARTYSFSETISGDYPEDEKEVVNMCMESHLVSENFALHSLKKDAESFKVELKPNEAFPTITPEIFEETELNPKKLYKYKRITLDGDNVVIVRFTVDGHEIIDEERKDILIRAVHDTGRAEWIAKWDQHSSSIKQEVMRDNSIKFVKWLLVAYCTGISNIKIGYTVRKSSKKDNDHFLIKVENLLTSECSKYIGFDPREQLASLNLVLKHLRDMGDDEGEFVINKSGFKSQLSVYKVPEADGGNEDEEDGV